ncbi:hypothetical protein COLO4_08261 [Corchorus olitorius]|uniref:Uncharacterized protein n=1 Tax=Corchorus olitorius TaxID=93759 RepID=A0A1R3KGK8_9ROSI|nr:hypothetical protein COLO4_08261 [Corchorus olitorius]
MFATPRRAHKSLLLEVSHNHFIYCPYLAWDNSIRDALQHVLVFPSGPIRLGRGGIIDGIAFNHRYCHHPCPRGSEGGIALQQFTEAMLAAPRRAHKSLLLEVSHSYFICCPYLAWVSSIRDALQHDPVFSSGPIGLGRGGIIDGIA